MSQILADDDMIKQLEAANGPVPVVDGQGTVIAVCTPIRFPRSPYTREEIERSRQQCRESGGKPLAEIITRLREQHP